ncbi:response regulator transcription factor [Sulfurimonas sediminis]|nr:response regulator transcription factor [Sulfurimonas sediminis]
MKKISILMIEDDLVLAELISDYLRNADMDILIQGDPTTILSLLKNKKFDIIILDLTLPKMDGLFLCEQISTLYKTPIIISSARGGVSDKVLGLEKGADDYIAKPYDPRELVARIHAHLRQKKSNVIVGQKIQFGEFSVDKARMLIFQNENELSLTIAEYGILLLFLEERGRVLSRGTILDSVDGMSWESDERSIDVIISRLRCKLGDTPRNSKYIESIRGIGYRMKE